MGWYTSYNGGGSKVTLDDKYVRNTNIYAHWEKKSYTVSFDSRGATSVAPQTVQYGGYVKKPNSNPKKGGWKFTGWYKNEACTIPFDFSTTQITGDTTIYAGWEVDWMYFTVDFNTVGGSAVPSQKVREGDKVIMPEPPTSDYDNLVFGGWYKDAAKIMPFDFDTEVQGNMTLYAKWVTPSSEWCNVYFQDEDGDLDFRRVKCGGIISRPTPDPTKDGYFLENWYEDIYFTKPFNFNQPITQNPTYAVANWVEGYAVTFDGNGSDSGSTNTIGNKPGVTVNLPDNGFVRAGHTFAGWNTRADGKGQTYADKAEFTFPSANTTLYAQWEINTYTVTFDGNGATNGATDSLFGQTYNSYVYLPANGFSRAGYIFTGWNTKANGSGTSYDAEDDGITVLDNITLYAQWEAEFVPVYRLFNRATGEHLYSTDKGEYDALVARGWIGENIAWYAPSESATPVYRLFNPVSGDHHYTASEVEIGVLTSQRGWVLEGDAQTGVPVVLFYSDDLERVPLMRLHKPGLAVGGHLHTSDPKEYEILQTRGWVGEGISFYGAQLP